MTFDDFIKKWDGKLLDYDNAYSGQCVDVIQQYSVEVLGIGSWGSGNAVGRWTNYPKEHFDRIANTPEGVPQKGDVMIWGTGAGPYGHIAVFIEGTAGSFRSFDQNWPVGSKCHIQGHYYNNVLGWLRPKKEAQMSCKIDDQKAKDMRRHLVYNFIKTYYFRTPTEKEVADHADWIDRDSGDSYNYKGMAEWTVNQVNEAEFKANWVEKKVADNATKVAQEKCNTTIAKTQVEAQKEIDKLQEDHKKSIEEQEALFNDHTATLENKITELTLQVEKLKSQTNGLTEKVVVELLIINWIKKLFKKE